jgi:Fe-S-cluster containining protein
MGPPSRWREEFQQVENESMTDFRSVKVNANAQRSIPPSTRGAEAENRAAFPLMQSKPCSRVTAPPAAAAAQVRAVYADLERRPVERACTRLAGCCQFKLTGLVPSMTRGEAMLAVAALRATGRKRLPESVGGACPLLEAATGRCLIYASRPFGCRTHFCRAAGGPYERREVLDLIRRLEAVDAALGHRDGPRPLPAAMAAELAR